MGLDGQATGDNHVRRRQFTRPTDIVADAGVSLPVNDVDPHTGTDPQVVAFHHPADQVEMVGVVGGQDAHRAPGDDRAAFNLRQRQAFMIDIGKRPADAEGAGLGSRLGQGDIGDGCPGMQVQAPGGAGVDPGAVLDPCDGCVIQKH